MFYTLFFLTNKKYLLQIFCLFQIVQRQRKARVMGTGMTRKKSKSRSRVTVASIYKIGGPTPQPPLFHVRFHYVLPIRNPNLAVKPGRSILKTVS